MLLLGGLGEGPHAIKSVVKVLGERGYNVAGLAIPYKDSDLIAIGEISREAPIEAVHMLNERANRKEDKPIHIVGHSGGGTAAILTRCH